MSTGSVYLSYNGYFLDYDKHNPAIGPLHMLFLLQENHKAHALIFFRSLLTCYLIRDTLMA